MHGEPERNAPVVRGGFESIDPDRLTALEARLAQHERAERAARPLALASVATAIGGIAFAAAALFAVPPVMLALSAACAFVLFGLNRKGLASVNAVALVAMLLVQFVFVPALTEMDRRAEEATTNMISTMVSGSELPVVVPPGSFDLPEDMVPFPTPVFDDGFSGSGSVAAP
jgi:hypothetical protein